MQPGAVDGGPIALVEEGDLIEIDVMERKLNIIGIAGERKSMEEIDEILAKRRKNWKPREAKYKKRCAASFQPACSQPYEGSLSGVLIMKHKFITIGEIMLSPDSAGL